MLEFELCGEVSEELTSGKRIWNSAWLDSQVKSRVARQAAQNQINGAFQASAKLCEKMKLLGNS